MFFTSVAIIAAMVLFSVIVPETAETVFDNVKARVISDAGWFYVLTVAIIITLVTFLAVSRFGDIKLGKDHSEPDYSYGSWFAMLFSAGMGIGLMFFGVAEPVTHFTAPPMADPGTIAAAKEAMRATFFHWGLHAWSIYAIVGLILAYFSFRHGLPLTLRSALYPLIGKKIYGPLGHAVDIFAVVGTVFGVATSLGFGVEQVNAGLNYLFGLPKNEWVQVGLIVAITGLATISVVTGLDAGIRRLSELNLGLAFLLLAFVLLLGPTVFLLDEDKVIDKIGSVGRPQLLTEVRIVDRDGRDVPPGDAGELLIRGPNITPGYWNRPDATAEAIRADGWLHSGDVARCDEDGQYFIVDRWKDMYISGGENVYPAEVEKVLEQHPAIAEVAVVGMPDDKWGEVGKAYYGVHADRDAPDPEALRAFCRERLAGYKVPKAFERVDALPRNALGKVTKQELRDHAKQ